MEDANDWTRWVLMQCSSDSRISWASSEASRRTMRSNRGRDTSFERRIRSELHRRGLRYRVNRRPVPDVRRTADVVFVRARIAVMLDGCFWHRCPDHFVMPKTNVEWWAAKFARNQQRDRETTNLLVEAGWKVLRFWEHQPTDEIADMIEGTVGRYYGRPRTAAGT